MQFKVKAPKIAMMARQSNDVQQNLAFPKFLFLEHLKCIIQFDSRCGGG